MTPHGCWPADQQPDPPAPASLAGGRELTPDEYKAREVVVQESADGWFRLHPSLRTEEAYKDYLRSALSLWAKMSGSPAPPWSAPRAESDSQSESDYEPGAGAERNGVTQWEPDDELKGYGYVHVERMNEKHWFALLAGEPFDITYRKGRIELTPQVPLAATREVAGRTREGGSREEGQ